MTALIEKFNREKTALKFFLIGRNYSLALKALGFAEKYHIGFRKDGVTPEFHHQIRIALTITQLKDILNEELCITAALLHDVVEDYDILPEVIEKEFGKEVRDVVWRLTKKFSSASKEQALYVDELGQCPHASVIKGVDREDNLNSMCGVFSVPKMSSYAKEAEDVFLPMLKRASKLFPSQNAAYSMVRRNLKNTISWVNAYVKLDQAKQEQHSA